MCQFWGQGQNKEQTCNLRKLGQKIRFRAKKILWWVGFSLLQKKTNIECFWPVNEKIFKIHLQLSLIFTQYFWHVRVQFQEKADEYWRSNGK